MQTSLPLSGKTRLVPILAHPVDHVRAPSSYNPAFAAAGLDWFMMPMGVAPADLAATLVQLGRLSNLQGLNLTIPHKAAAYALCTRVTAEAQDTGMANTLRKDAGGQWSGANSDGIGFVGAARANGLLDTKQPVVIIGAGGAGTAIAFALVTAGVQQIDVLDADAARALHLQQTLRRRFPHVACGMRREALKRAGLTINATPLGLEPDDPLAVDPALLPAGSALFDIIAARDTELMAAARQRGLRVLGGRPMIAHQLAYQIAFWGGDTHGNLIPTEPRQ